METETQDWILLPVDDLLRVLSYLEPIQLLRSSEVCKIWELYAKTNELWRPVCNEYEVSVFSDVETTEKSDLVYVDVYKAWFTKYKYCVNEYPRIKSLVNKFNTFAQEKNINFELKGVDIDVVSKIDSSLRSILKNITFPENQLVLPEDLVCWYQMCFSNEPIMGGYSFYDHEVRLSFVPLQFMASAAQRVRNNAYAIPFCISPGESKVMLIVIQDFRRFHRGNIVTYYPNSPDKFQLVATSFSAWMHDHVTKCLSGCYSFQDECINLFPRINVPEAVTRGLYFHTLSLTYIYFSYT